MSFFKKTAITLLILEVFFNHFCADSGLLATPKGVVCGILKTLLSLVVKKKLLLICIMSLSR